VAPNVEDGPEVKSAPGRQSMADLTREAVWKVPIRCRLG